MVLYAADNFATAFAEAVVRDRFEGKARRFLYCLHLEQLRVAAIGSSRELVMLNLRGSAACELGVDTDASRARDHAVGQALSEVIHAAMPDVDAILFDSRRTSGACVAIYERALPTLSANPPIGLLQTALLPAELTRGLGSPSVASAGLRHDGAGDPPDGRARPAANPVA